MGLRPQAVLRWVEGDPDGRSQDEVRQLLGAVRLPAPVLAASLAAASPPAVGLPSQCLTAAARRSCVPAQL